MSRNSSWGPSLCGEIVHAAYLATFRPQDWGKEHKNYKIMIGNAIQLLEYNRDTFTLRNERISADGKYIRLLHPTAYGDAMLIGEILRQIPELANLGTKRGVQKLLTGLIFLKIGLPLAKPAGRLLISFFIELSRRTTRYPEPLCAVGISNDRDD